VISTALFWGSVIAIFYTYLGYILLLICYGALRRRRVQKASITPSMSLIIAAYNEEHSLAKKLENSLHLDYPADALEIIVASDGSDDRTNSIVKDYALYGVRLLALPRKGKMIAVDEAAANARNEILVFSDANALFDSQALRKIARNFADTQVGGVCGNQIYVSSEKRDSEKRDSVAQGEQIYWNYDKWLKQLETLTGSIVSADGSVYAIRRELYETPASFSVTDDFAISTAVVAQGYRLVFESEAIAYEEPTASAKREFNRKVRIINRGLRGIMLRKKLLNPVRYGFYALILFSHKLLRRLVPIFLLILFITSIILSPHSAFYFGMSVAQASFYGVALASFALRNTRLGQQKMFCLPLFYCLANVAALVAIVKLLAGKRIERWQPQR
jgi:cellulose synthase/poly-beta-1,6-N-acetylglucosamine synthase-like glycosyltransferase